MTRKNLANAATAWKMTIADHYAGRWESTVDARMVFLFLTIWMEMEHKDA